MTVAVLCLTLFRVLSLAAAVYMVMTDHPWWALLCFLICIGSGFSYEYSSKSKR